ncbi:MAG: sialate O-acetylesterase [Phenylobacterium sp.]
MSEDQVIFAGQSNALGFGNTGPAPYTPTAQVQIWTDTNGDGTPDAWNYMNPGVNTGTFANPTVWGPEVEFANEWLADNPTGHLWIVKVTKGETALQENSGLDWAPTSPSTEMFGIATATIDAARNNLNGSPYAFSQWDAAFWMQGETDAGTYQWAHDYVTNIANFIPAAKAAWDVGKFALGQIGTQGADWAWVRYGQAVAPDDAAPVDTVNFGRSDGVHLNAAGQVALGDGFYSIFDSWF